MKFINICYFWITINNDISYDLYNSKDIDYKINCKQIILK